MDGREVAGMSGLPSEQDFHGLKEVEWLERRVNPLIMCQVECMHGAHIYVCV